MNSRVLLFFVMVMAVSYPLGAQNQNNSDRTMAISSRLKQFAAVAGKLPRGVLSGSLQNVLQIADRFEQLNNPLQNLDSSRLEHIEQELQTYRSGVSGGPSSRGIPVNNSKADFLYSILGGFTQYETSTAWCGDHVVVAFADSGSILESLLFAAEGLSTTAAAFSTDGGNSFVDSGFVNPGSNTTNQLQGNGVVNCSNENTFYYTQIFATGRSSQPFASVALSKSRDGGQTWEDPIPAVSLDGGTHNTDKPWSTIDPTDHERLYVTYTDFDQSNTVCPKSQRSAIEMVVSSDGGNTWSMPAVVDQSCMTPPMSPVVQGSQVMVDSHGAVYVAWEAYTSTAPPISREMRIAKSVDHGVTFAPFVKIDMVTPVGIADITGFSSPIFPILQGNVLDNEWPSLAIDRSGTGTDGTVYVAWNDGRFHQVPDRLSLTGVYGYSTIVVSRSTDGGKTWSPVTRVNNSPIVLGDGRSTDEFQPAVAVDTDGSVAVCWFDRRADPENYLIGRSCSLSRDQGATWTDRPVTHDHWPPIKATDLFDTGGTFGDYNQLTSDFEKIYPGFLGAYNSVTTTNVPVPNQDIFLISLPKEE